MSASVGGDVTHSLTGVRLTCREEKALLIEERTRLQQEKERIEVNFFNDMFSHIPSQVELQSMPLISEAKLQGHA